ncbi:site-specific integrase [Mycetocola reblochoni]|uniref:Site-specific integrase n=1 Tax=Mycetocola reblochoni TaxID=331618 RepID=A0A3L6ZQE2_9MICO|nr:site-specific integrase [Mycetocola reblochoni]RLP70067.1 site-specific integrase [Mycetocola reblochoni]
MSRRANNDSTISAYTLSDGTERWRIAYWHAPPGGEPKRHFKKGFATEQAAEDALEDIRVDIRRGDHVQAARDTLDGYTRIYFDGLRVKPSTLDAYQRHYRNHIAPHLGRRKLSDITTADLNSLYRRLERSGRKDSGHHGEPLSAATVRHVHAILVQVLSAAVADNIIRANPATARNINPPTLAEAAAPEMTVWTPEQARAFLTWSKADGDYLQTAWHLLLATGMRRGEALALRWRDVDVTNGRLSITRSLSYVKVDGKKKMTFQSPKSGKKRVVDIDTATVEVLKSHKTAMSVHPEFVKPDSTVMVNRFGQPLNPERFSVQFTERVKKAQGIIADLPMLKVHELRHTHATMLLVAGAHPKVVQERLGHATINITLSVYSHLNASMQRGAADTIGGLLTDES